VHAPTPALGQAVYQQQGLQSKQSNLQASVLGDCPVKGDDAGQVRTADNSSQQNKAEPIDSPDRDESHDPHEAKPLPTETP
jgi:hypothetical protein